jgi:hypothetical protein
MRAVSNGWFFVGAEILRKYDENGFLHQDDWTDYIQYLQDLAENGMLLYATESDQMIADMLYRMGFIKPMYEILRKEERKCYSSEMMIAGQDRPTSTSSMDFFTV